MVDIDRSVYGQKKSHPSRCYLVVEVDARSRLDSFELSFVVTSLGLR